MEIYFQRFELQRFMDWCRVCVFLTVNPAIEADPIVLSVKHFI